MLKWTIFAIILQMVVATAAEYSAFQEICMILVFIQVTIAVGVTKIIKVLEKERGQQ